MQASEVQVLFRCCQVEGRVQASEVQVNAYWDYVPLTLTMMLGGHSWARGLGLG